MCLEVMCCEGEAGWTRQCSRMEADGWRRGGSGGGSNKTMGVELRGRSGGCHGVVGSWG